MNAKKIKPLLFDQFGLLMYLARLLCTGCLVPLYHMYLIQSLKLFFKIHPVTCKQYEFLWCCDSFALCSLILGLPIVAIVTSSSLFL